MNPDSRSFEYAYTSMGPLMSLYVWFMARHVVVKAIILLLVFTILWEVLKQVVRQALRLVLRTPGYVSEDIVLSKYEINRADPMNLVHMIGRRAGLWGWLWNRLGVGKSFEMHVSERFVMLFAPGLFEGMHAVIPTERVLTAASGYHRPMWPLLLAGFLLLYLWTIPPLAVFSCALVLYLFYWRRRAVRVMVSAGEGFWGFTYLIGEAGSFEKAAATLQLLRSLITTGSSRAYAVLPDAVPGAQPFGPVVPATPGMQTIGPVPAAAAGAQTVGPFAQHPGVSHSKFAPPPSGMGAGSQMLPTYPASGYPPNGYPPGGNPEGA